MTQTLTQDRMSSEIFGSQIETDVFYQSKKAPMALFLPDYFFKFNNEALVNHLANNGISTAMVRYRGVGNSEGNFSLAGAMYDSEIAHAELRKQYPHDEKKFVLIGYSHGGLFAINIAKDNPQIKNIACISPLMDIKKFLKNKDLQDIFESGNENGIRGDPRSWVYDEMELEILNNPIGNYVFQKPSLQFSQQVQRAGTLEAKTLIEHMKINNLLVMHGTNDVVISPDDGKKLFELSPGKKRLELIEGADHVYSREEHYQEMLSKLTDYICGVCK